MNTFYVNKATGVDTTSNGSRDNPFKNVKYAISQSDSGDTIYVAAGIYNVTTTGGSYGYGGLDDLGKRLKIIGTPRETIFLCDGTNINTSRDHHAICTRNESTEIHKVIFQVFLGSRSNNYSRAIIGRDAYEATRGQYYNCVFEYMDKEPSFIYDNNSQSNVHFYNCIFKTPANISPSYSGQSCYYSEYSVFTKQPPSGEGNFTNIVSNASLNDDYTLQDPFLNETHGVYGGASNWVLEDEEDLECSLEIKVTKKDMNCYLQIQKESVMPSSITVEDFTIFDSWIAITENNTMTQVTNVKPCPVNDVESTITVEQFDVLQSAIGVQEHNHMTFDSDLLYNPYYYMLSNITVVRKEGSHLSTYLTVPEFGYVYAKADLRHEDKNNINGSLSVIHKTGTYFPSSMAIKFKNHMEGQTDFVNSALESFESSIDVWYRDEFMLNSWISVPYKNRMEANTDIKGAGNCDVAATISVNKPTDFEGMIYVPPTNKMAGIVDIQPPIRITKDLKVEKDAYVRSGLPRLNFGFDDSLVTGYWKNRHEIFESVMAFDIEPMIKMHQDYKVERVKVRLYHSTNKNIDIPLYLYEALEDWQEFGITWKNKPEKGNLVTDMYETHEGYIEFDITDYVIQQKEKKNPLLNLYLLTDTLLGETEFFYSKELEDATAPRLYYTYFDDVIKNTGRGVLDSNILAVYPDSDDLKSKINVFTHPGKEDISAQLKILWFGKSRSDLSSSIAVTRDTMKGSMFVYQVDDSDLQGNITVQEYGLNDFEPCSIGVSRRTAEWQVYVKHRLDIPSTIAIRRSAESDIFGWGRTTAESRPGTIEVNPYYDMQWIMAIQNDGESKFPSSLTVSEGSRQGSIEILERNDLLCSIQFRNDGEELFKSSIAVSIPEIDMSVKVNPYYDRFMRIFVRQTEESDVTSTITSTVPSMVSDIYVVPYIDWEGSITVRRTEVSEIETSIASTRPSQPSNIYVVPYIDWQGDITVRRSDESQIEGSIAVTRPSAEFEFLVRYRDDFESDISVRRDGQFDQMFSLMKIRKWLDSSIHPKIHNDLKTCDIIVRQRENADLDSSIYVLNRLDIPSKFDIVGASKLPSSIQVLSEWFAGTIGIPAYDTTQALFTFLVRLSDYSTINSSINVHEVNDFETNMVIRGTEHCPIDSDITVRLRRASFFYSTVDVYEKSVVNSTITVQQNVDEDFKSDISARQSDFSQIAGQINTLAFSLINSIIYTRVWDYANTLSDIYVLFNKNLDADIYVKYRKDITGRILAVHPDEANLDSWIYAVARDASDLPTSFRVTYGDSIDVKSTLRIEPQNKMSGIVDIVEPTRKKTQFFVKKDSYVRSDIPKLNYGEIQSLVSGKTETREYKSYLGFNDSSRIPTSHIVEKAELRIYYLRKMPQGLSLFTTNDNWSEYGITWANKTDENEKLTDLFTVNEEERYITFDITEYYLEQFKNGNPLHNFIINSEETNYLLSKESGKFPVISVQHYNPVVENFGRGNIDSSILAVYGINEDFESAIEVTTKADISEIEGSILVPIHANEVTSSKPSTIAITRSGLESNIKAVIRENPELESSLQIRETAVDDLSIDMHISRTNLDNSIFVKFTNDLQSSFNIAESKEVELFSWLTISNPFTHWMFEILNRNNMPSRLTVIGFGETQLPTEMIISCPIVNGEIVVRQNKNNDLESDIAIRKDGDSSIESSIIVVGVVDRDFYSTINVLESEDLSSTIEVQCINDLECSFEIVYKDGLHEFDSTIGVTRDSLECMLRPGASYYQPSSITIRVEEGAALQSAIAVNITQLFSQIKTTKPFDTLSEIVVRQRENSDLETTITITNPSLETDIYVLNRYDIDTDLYIRNDGERSLDSQIKVIDDKLPSELNVTISNDLPSNFYTRVVGEENLNATLKITQPTLPSDVLVKYSHLFDSSIIISVPKEDDFSASIEVLPSHDIEGTIEVWGASLLEGSIRIASGNLASVIGICARIDEDFNSEISIRNKMKDDIESSIYIVSDWKMLDSLIGIRERNEMVFKADIHAYAEYDMVGQLRPVHFDTLASKIAIKFKNHMEGEIDFIPVGMSDLNGMIHVSPASNLPSSITALKYGDSSIDCSLYSKAQGKVELPSEIDIVYRGDSNLVSSIKIPPTNKMTGKVFIISVDENDLDSWIEVHEFLDTPSSITARQFAESEIPSSLMVHEHSNLDSSVSCRRTTENDLDSIIAARRSDLNEIPGSVSCRRIKDSNLDSSIWPIVHYDIPSDISCRRTAESDLDSSIYILHHKDMEGSIWPIIHFDIDSEITARQSDLIEIDCSISCRQTDESDLESSIWPIIHHDTVCSIICRQADESDLESSIWPIIHYDVNGSIACRQTDESDISCSISCRQTDNSDFESSIWPIIHSDMDSWIAARQTDKNDIDCSITCRQRDNSDLDSSIACRQVGKNDLPSQVWPRYSKDIDGEIYVLHHKDINCSIDVITQHPYAYIM